MFNLQSETNRLKQLNHDKIHGLPNKPKQHNPKVQHIDDTPLDNQAEQEGIYISRRYRNRTMDFGRRLIKSKGQRHYPGGGYAGHSIKGG